MENNSKREKWEQWSGRERPGKSQQVAVSATDITGVWNEMIWEQKQAWRWGLPAEMTAQQGFTCGF